MKNLMNSLIGVSEFKAKINEVISNNLTKVIIKNNKPVSVVLPYEEYLALKEQAEENTKNLSRIGQDIILSNGVPVMVTVSKDDDGLCIKTYIKMKTTGDYKLDFTHKLGNPIPESVYTADELVEQMRKKIKNSEK